MQRHKPSYQPQMRGRHARMAKKTRGLNKTNDQVDEVLEDDSDHASEDNEDPIGKLQDYTFQEI